MSDFIERAARLSPKRLLLLAGELQTRLEAASKQPQEDLHAPVAVVGMACRFPGARDPQSFWELISSGKDAIRETPRDRWDAEAFYDPDPAASGKIATRWGGFIEDIFDFDPGLFGITPREAMSMDPQQRLILQVAWEAFESAGLAPDGQQGSAAGVFVGACNYDYLLRLNSAGDDYADMYLSTGNAHSVISGRVSYLFGLQGPSLTVDTACSSSMTALYLAVESLRSRTCRVALAGGVNAILSPETSVALSRARMMAADGRCKAFDASADGFVRSEGCGLVVLKRLEDALFDNDRILAVIRGAAINQDGRSNGLTAPNGPSQAAVIRAALADAGISPALVSYVETHGTGTSLGDPIEAQALGEALGGERPGDQPVRIGSVKTNIGHLESAAGIASLIKLILMLQHGQIAPNLHFHTPNPYIPWERLPLEVPTELLAWEPEHGRRIGGISSFGFSGTNVHVVLEAPPSNAPETGTAETDQPSLQVLALSAQGEKALHELAQRYALSLASLAEEDFPDFCSTARTGRSSLPDRLALVAGSAQEARGKLAMFLENSADGGVQRGTAVSGTRPEPIFLFTGHGAQAAGMGAELYQSSEVYRQMFDRAAALFDAELPQPLAQIVYGEEREKGNALLNERMLFAQAAMFSLQAALAEQWRACGVMPAAVLGHSLGEYAAAWLAGVFSLEDAVKLVLARGRLLDSIPSVGAMAAVFASSQAVSEILADFPGVEIAAINGPQETVITGPAERVSAALEAFRLRRVRARRLAVTQAAHSAAVEPWLDDFEAVARTIRYSEPEVMYISSSLGRAAMPGEVTNAGYWRAHLRGTVRFESGMKALAPSTSAVTSTLRMHPSTSAVPGTPGGLGFVEIGPAPVLLALGQRCLPEVQAGWMSSLRPGQGDRAQMLESMARLWVSGHPVNWMALSPSRPHHKILLPTYPFQPTRYCAEVPTEQRAKQAKSPGAENGSSPVRQHPLVVGRLSSPALKDEVYEAQAGITNPPFLAHHRVHGQALLPSPAFLEMAFEAGADCFPEARVIEDFNISTGLVLPEGHSQKIQIVIGAGEGNRREFQIYSPGPGGKNSPAGWIRHASGWLTASVPAQQPGERLDLASVKGRCPSQIDAADYYGGLQNLGLEFGPSFRGLRQVWRGVDEALGEVILPDDLLAEAQRYTFHPAFLDACFHLLGAPVYDQPLDNAYLLIAIERFHLYRRPGRRLWNHTVIRPQAGKLQQAFTADVNLYDEDGEPVAVITGIHLKLAQRAALLHALHALPEDWFYQVKWQERPRPAQPAGSRALAEPARRWLVFADRGGVGAELAKRLHQEGDEALLVEAGQEFLDTGSRVVINSSRPEDFQRLFSLPDARAINGAVYLWALDAAGQPGDQDLHPAALEACMGLVGALQLPLKMWAVTRNAQPAGDLSTPLALAQAPVWGLGRVASLEQPASWGGLIDLDAAMDATAGAEAIAQELLQPDGEDALAWRSGRRLAARLERTPAPQRLEAEFKKDGAYLITGGLGGLGLRLAKWLAENGAGSLILAGRSPLPDRSTWPTYQGEAEIARRIAAIQAIEALGTVVHTPVLDVADAPALQALLGRCGADLPPLRGVIHSAAHLSSERLDALDRTALEQTFRPKVQGAWLLHQATRDLDLDFFILFSSTTALWGVEGMGAYAGANSFLDSLAHERRRCGLPALSINWGTWEVMRMASEADQARYARFGLIPMEPAAALDCLGSLLVERGEAQVSIAAVDWKRLRPAYEARRLRPFFASLEGPAAGQALDSTDRKDFSWGDQLAGLDREARRAALLALVLGSVAQVSRSATPDSIDPQQGLFEMGLDSLMSVELKGLLEKGAGRSLPPTLTFNYPTPADLAGYLEEVLFPAPAADAVEPPPEEAGSDDLEDLSEAELERMLEERLRRIS